MRIYNLFGKLIDKYTPMDESEAGELNIEAVNFYNKIIAENIHIKATNAEAILYNSENSDRPGFEKKPLKAFKLKNKIVEYIDQWWMRYAFALLFIYLVPKISNFISGSGGLEEDEEESEVDDFKRFIEYQRFKKSNT